MLTSVVAKLTPHAVKTLKKLDPEKYDFLPDEGVGPVTIQYDFGDDIPQAVEFFTEKICLNLIAGHAKFGMQGLIRDALAQGKNPEEIQAKFYNLEAGIHNWKPAQAGPRKSVEEKERDRLMKLDPDARAQQKAALQKMLDNME